MNTDDEIAQATRAAMAAMFAITDQTQPPETARAVLLGIAATIIATLLEEAPGTATAEAINTSWAERGFGWRMARLQ